MNEEDKGSEAPLPPVRQDVHPGSPPPSSPLLRIPACKTTEEDHRRPLPASPTAAREPMADAAAGLDERRRQILQQLGLA